LTIPFPCKSNTLHKISLASFHILGKNLVIIILKKFTDGGLVDHNTTVVFGHYNEEAEGIEYQTLINRMLREE